MMGVGGVVLLRGEPPTNTSKTPWFLPSIHTRLAMKKCTKNKTREPAYGFVSDGWINLKFNEYLIGVLSCFVGGISEVGTGADGPNWVSLKKRENRGDKLQHKVTLSMASLVRSERTRIDGDLMSSAICPFRDLSSMFVQRAGEHTYTIGVILGIIIISQHGWWWWWW